MKKSVMIVITIIVIIIGFVAGQKYQRNYDLKNIQIVDVSNDTVYLKFDDGRTDNGKIIDSEVEEYSYIPSAFTNLSISEVENFFSSCEVTGVEENDFSHIGEVTITYNNNDYILTYECE